MIFFSIIAIIALRPVQLSSSFKNKEEFLLKLNTAMKSIDYKLTNNTGDIFIYSHASKLLTRQADISAKINSNTAVITGHFSYTRRLQKLLV